MIRTRRFVSSISLLNITEAIDKTVAKGEITEVISFALTSDKVAYSIIFNAILIYK